MDDVGVTSAWPVGGAWTWLGRHAQYIDLLCMPPVGVANPGLCSELAHAAKARAWALTKWQLSRTGKNFHRQKLASVI